VSGGDLPGGPGTEGRIGRVLALRGWPLLAVLAVQAALSLQLIWANTAFRTRACTCGPGTWNWPTCCGRHLCRISRPIFPARR